MCRGCVLQWISFSLAGKELQYSTKESLSSQNVLGGDMLVPRNISGS